MSERDQWRYEFTISCSPPRWYRRSWKATATCTHATYRTIEMAFRPVHLFAKGETRDQALMEVKKQVDQYGADLRDRARSREPSESYTVLVPHYQET